MVAPVTPVGQEMYPLFFEQALEGGKNLHEDSDPQMEEQPCQFPFGYSWA